MCMCVFLCVSVCSCVCLCVCVVCIRIHLLLFLPNYNQQDVTFPDLFISTYALHFSRCSSTHHQEHITIHKLQVLSTNNSELYS